MAAVIQLKDGGVETVFDLDGLLRIIDERMGDEARRWLEEWLLERESEGDYIDDLETELKSAKEHHRDVICRVREQSETIARLIREKNIDRAALSHAAGIIGMITWRELNV